MPGWQQAAAQATGLPDPPVPAVARRFALAKELGVSSVSPASCPPTLRQASPSRARAREGLKPLLFRAPSSLPVVRSRQRSAYLTASQVIPPRRPEADCSTTQHPTPAHTPPQLPPCPTATMQGGICAWVDRVRQACAGSPATYLAAVRRESLGSTHLAASDAMPAPARTQGIPAGVFPSTAGVYPVASRRCILPSTSESAHTSSVTAILLRMSLLEQSAKAVACPMQPNLHRRHRTVQHLCHLF
jgi:hypothetical protein